MSLLDSLSGGIEDLTAPQAPMQRVEQDLNPAQLNVDNAVYFRMQIDPELRAKFADKQNPVDVILEAAANDTADEALATVTPIRQNLREELTLDEQRRNLDYIYEQQAKLRKPA